MSNKLNILWTSDNPNTAHLMVFMYAINSITKGWWNEVTVIIWGASAKLVAEDKAIQEKIKMAEHSGVKVSACLACATQFGVVEHLTSLGIEVKYWGESLTELIKNNEYILSI